MRPDTLQGWLREVPFRPFRLHLTSGVAFDIRHPDQAIVHRDRLALTPAGPASVGPQRIVNVSLLHIIYIETIPITPSPSAN
jgi:hypothetical protein